MKKQNKLVKISQYLLITCLLTIGLTGIATASIDQYTGCLSTNNPTKGVYYNFRPGITPLGNCKTGDIVVGFYDKTYVDSAVNSISTKITDLQSKVSTLESKVSALETKVDTYDNLLKGVTRDANEIYIDGANVHIRSGSGSTYGTVNGLGNLIVGYNEPRAISNDRSGSHNLIIGANNNYKSYGGLVAGVFNEISGPFASVSGGEGNVASGPQSAVSGGSGNEASGVFSSVSGGSGNIASGHESSVSGGSENKASGQESSISGGSGNKASGYRGSSVSGGLGNTASGTLSSVSGGHTRSAPFEFNWVAGNLLETH